ncbi:MAG: Fur family transcriptional regulator [Anaerolineaceae bacterium]|nr:Fur family transcriptional regulator [Anaerolineaceae bacterium]
MNLPESTSPYEPLQSVSDQWLEKLSTSGYRLTNPLRVIVKVFTKSGHTLSPNQVFDEARRIYPQIGLVTVYRTLEKLEELGLIWRVHEVAGCHTYVAAPVSHQHLLICRACNRAEYIQGEEIETLMAHLGAESGYIIQDHWLQLFGVCCECQT